MTTWGAALIAAFQVTPRTDTTLAIKRVEVEAAKVRAAAERVSALHTIEITDPFDDAVAKLAGDL